MDATNRTTRKSPIKNTNFNNNKSIINNNNNNSNNSNKNDTRYENLTKQMLDLQYQLAEYDVDFNDLKESNEFLINERLILEESLAEAEQKIKQLNQKKDELEKLIEDLKKTEYQTPDLTVLHFHKIENENLKNELEYKKQEIAKYKSDLNTKQELIQQLNLKLEAQETRIDSLKKQSDEYRAKLLKIEDDYKDKIVQLQTDYQQKDEQYSLIVSKYLKHRKIWEENYEKANFEVKKLDEVIDNVIETLKSKIDVINQIPEIKLLLDQLTTDQ